MMGITCDCLWIMNLAKEMAKALERKNGFLGTFIYENNGNYEKKEVKGHMLHVRRKMKKIEASSIKMLMRINW